MEQLAIPTIIEHYRRGRPKKNELRPPKPEPKPVGRPKKYTTSEEYRLAKVDYNKRYQDRLKQKKLQNQT